MVGPDTRRSIGTYLQDMDTARRLAADVPYFLLLHVDYREYGSLLNRVLSHNLIAFYDLLLILFVFHSRMPGHPTIAVGCTGQNQSRSMARMGTPCHVIYRDFLSMTMKPPLSYMEVITSLTEVNAVFNASAPKHMTNTMYSKAAYNA